MKNNNSTLETIIIMDTTYELQEIAVDDIADLWNTKVPTLILRKDGVYYYTHIQRAYDYETLVVVFHGKKHICGYCGRQYALPYPDGCEKVAGYTSHIELYPWITLGLETLNTGRDIFIVCECKHKKPEKKAKKLSVQEKQAMIVGLAQNVRPEIQDLKGVDQLLKDNGVPNPRDLKRKIAEGKESYYPRHRK